MVIRTLESLLGNDSVNADNHHVATECNPRHTSILHPLGNEDPT